MFQKIPTYLSFLHNKIITQLRTNSELIKTQNVIINPIIITSNVMSK